MWGGVGMEKEEGGWKRERERTYTHTLVLLAKVQRSVGGMRVKKMSRFSLGERRVSSVQCAGCSQVDMTGVDITCI